ncbi:hypothetical protein [Luteimonas sp. A501]
MKVQQEAAATAAADVTNTKRPNLLVRFLHWYWGKREEGEKGNPIARTLIALVLIAAGVAGSEFYQWARGQLVGPDEFLVDIKEQQETSFDKLQKSLDALTSSVEGGNRNAMSEVRGAVSEIRGLSSSLIAQLELANSENQRLSQVVGVPGGLDIILTAHTGMPLDSHSEVAVQNIQPYGAMVAVTPREGPTEREFLQSGESIAYAGADGRSCRVILRSIEQDRAVSLANRCT